MEPFSVAGTCIALVGTITKVTTVLAGFVHDVRSARNELDAVSRELSSIKRCLELLARDFDNPERKRCPEQVQKQINGITINCSIVIVDIEKTLTKNDGTSLMKAARWATGGKEEIEKLRLNLEAHKCALDIALQFWELTVLNDIKTDTEKIYTNTSTIPEIKENTALILAEIAHLQERLPHDAVQNHTSQFMLGKYLDDLTSYAATVCDTFSDESQSRSSWEMATLPASSSTPWLQKSGIMAEEADESQAIIDMPVNLTNPLVTFESELLSPRQQFYLTSSSDYDFLQCCDQDAATPPKSDIIRPNRQSAAPSTINDVMPMLPRPPIGEDAASLSRDPPKLPSHERSTRTIGVHGSQMIDESSWSRLHVEPEDVQELLGAITAELKSRTLDIPLFLLPFRPVLGSCTEAQRFISKFFSPIYELHGFHLIQVLQILETVTLANLAKWSWSRLVGGIVTWKVYEAFCRVEMDSQMAMDSFVVSMARAVKNESRKKIVFDFFDLLATIATQADRNDFELLKLSRYAAWWAFEKTGSMCEFQTQYREWLKAADATSHLFFGYLRAMAKPSTKMEFHVPLLPKALCGRLLKAEYPPKRKSLFGSRAKLIHTSVPHFSPTPQASIWRASYIPYSDNKQTLRKVLKLDNSARPFSTLECHRVLESISNDANSLPSWAGFIGNEFSGSLIPLNRRNINHTPAELAIVRSFEMDDAFWWVWMTSLGPEETRERRAIFQRCALVETHISHNQREWVVIEESLRVP